MYALLWISPILIAVNSVRNLGWATDWCGVIARCRYRWILGGRGGHCLSSSVCPEDRVYRADRYIAVI